MTRYKLNNFKNNKAFIYQEENIDGNTVIGNRICINTKCEKLFELPDKDMIVDSFEDENVAFVKYKGKYALINNKGEFLTDFIYDRISSRSKEGLFEVEREGKHGHIDMQGKEVVPCMYNGGSYFSEGVAAVYLNGKCGMIDCHNNTVIPFEYEQIGICINNLIDAKKNGKYGVINKNNEVIADFIYNEIDCWYPSKDWQLRLAKKGKKWGLINRFGEVKEDFIYDDVDTFGNNDDEAIELIVLLKGEQKALYSTKKQKFITDFIDGYFGSVSLSENRIPVNLDGKVGFIDKDGNQFIPFIFDRDSVQDFNEGVAVVSKNHKDGVIDLNGNLVVPCEYYRLHDCHEGLLLSIDSDRNSGYIDKKGNVIIPFGKFKSCSDFHCGLAMVWDAKHGNVYINKSGEILKIKA